MASWIGKHCARAGPISRPAEAGLRVWHMDSWRFVRAIPMSTADLRLFTGDVRVALANLKTRGYHIAHNTGAVRRITKIAPRVLQEPRSPTRSI